MLQEMQQCCSLQRLDAGDLVDRLPKPWHGSTTSEHSSIFPIITVSCSR